MFHARPLLNTLHSTFIYKPRVFVTLEIKESISIEEPRPVHNKISHFFHGMPLKSLKALLLAVPKRRRP